MFETLKKQFIFIVGSPRSGTTWLQILIGEHPKVATTVELTTFSRYLEPWTRTWKNEESNIKLGKWHQGLPVIWTESDFNSFINNFLENVYSKVLNKNNIATNILDKHPGY